MAPLGGPSSRKLLVVSRVLAPCPSYTGQEDRSAGRRSDHAAGEADYPRPMFKSEYRVACFVLRMPSLRQRTVA